MATVRLSPLIFHKVQRFLSWKLHILGELDFDHYLDRLTMRRLVASGRDCIGVDALCDLLGHLHGHPAEALQEQL